MNKYLTKIAGKIELEPGVYYDDARYLTSISTDKRRELDAAHKRFHGVILGVPYAAIGGVLGLMGSRSSLLPKSKITGALGGILGTAAGGALGYGLGRWSVSNDDELKKNREEFMIKTENKYSDKIFDTHGWNK